MKHLILPCLILTACGAAEVETQGSLHLVNVVPLETGRVCDPPRPLLIWAEDPETSDLLQRGIDPWVEYGEDVRIVDAWSEGVLTFGIVDRFPEANRIGGAYYHQAGKADGGCEIRVIGQDSIRVSIDDPWAIAHEIGHVLGWVDHIDGTIMHPSMRGGI